MIKKTHLHSGIPVSIALNSTLESEDIHPVTVRNKKRLLLITALAIVIAISISFIAKLLVYLIDLITNISFYGNFSVVHTSPGDNHLGLLVIIVPIIGGLVCGLMALYGSKAIRGHGIPEAMEQILTNQSKIKPAITYLKPLSSAISIGTGGPFGAEGPIIATGGALGSTLGQLLKISDHERKILLTAGAAAGMSAIFGSPIAAIFLAIELLLFEFSPRSILPVALACITGAAGHHFLFEAGPVFRIENLIAAPSNRALALYSFMGIVLGLISILVTKSVYLVEDAFEKIPLHWLWWPAIGGIAVGVVGYFAPRTLGVGYENITEILSGRLPINILFTLCLLKFVSWAVALGSGTSGGTLAPLLTIGGATGALMGSVLIFIFPGAGLTITLAALVGMSALFAGASRALLTSIVFALETTGESHALLPLLAGCTASYFVSFFFMENTIMTEKIVRRGVKIPQSYEPDILEKMTIQDIINEKSMILKEDNTVGEILDFLDKNHDYYHHDFIIVNKDNEFSGIVNSLTLLSNHLSRQVLVGSLVKPINAFIPVDFSLRTVVEKMAGENTDALPIISRENNIIGVISYKDILEVYKKSKDEHTKKLPGISIKKELRKKFRSLKKLKKKN